MGLPKGDRVIHAYDTERRRVLCGLTEQTNSTKHRSGVTCTSCRELLGEPRPADAPIDAGPSA